MLIVITVQYGDCMKETGGEEGSEVNLRTHQLEVTVKTFDWSQMTFIFGLVAYCSSEWTQQLQAHWPARFPESSALCPLLSGLSCRCCLWPLAVHQAQAPPPGPPPHQIRTASYWGPWLSSFDPCHGWSVSHSSLKGGKRVTTMGHSCHVSQEKDQ